MSEMFPFEWIESAARRIAPHITRTPLTVDAPRNLWLKWENQQVTGSFKARGALNKVLALEPWEQAAGIVTASAGNHGQGVALAGKIVGAPVQVFVSEHAVEKKVRAMQALGAQVERVAGGYELAEASAMRYAAEQGKTWVSAYNDGQVIAGQGTIGLEMSEQARLDERPTVYIPSSGGGLAAGVGAALAGLGFAGRVVAVQPAASPFLRTLFYGGRQEDVSEGETLADGLTGAVEAGSLTVPLVREFVDDVILVEEEEIARAVVFAWKTYGQVIEASAAVGLAAALAQGDDSLPALVIVSGGNIQPDLHAALCARFAEAD